MSPQPSFDPRKKEAFITVVFFALAGIVAAVQAWAYRHYVSADSISYLDMSDGVFPGAGWDRLITGTWSPLYPFLLGSARRLSPDPYHEIAIGHLLNVLIFVGALGAFEFFLRNAIPRERVPDSRSQYVCLPRWAYLLIGYTVFLWASIVSITMKSLRPDMLMAVFLLLAMGIVLRIRELGASWGRYLLLGAILGVGSLAKTPILPIGILILVSGVILARDWKLAVPKAVVSGAVLLAIGSLYFIPLSLKRGGFTLGESSSYNYLVHVDWTGGAPWYLQEMGRETGSGTFLHRAARIYDQPPAYSFSDGESVTYPIRFDPAYWAQGVTPRFHLGAQLRALAINLKLYLDIFERTAGVVAMLVAMWFLSGGGRRAIAGIATQWPVWFIGTSGLGMYAFVHVEDRYVGVFCVLLWMGLLLGLSVPATLVKRVAPGVAWGLAASILIPIIATVSSLAAAGQEIHDWDAEAAQALTRSGIKAGDKAGRISPGYNDLAWARIARVTVVTEVAIERADSFWESSPTQQEAVLRAMAAAGAKIVITHVTDDFTPAGWQRLGHTPYWMRWLNSTSHL
jgi:hypothetical protein